MTWPQRCRLRHHFKISIWILPAIGIVVALMSLRCLHGMEKFTGMQSESGANATRSLLETPAGSMFNFTVQRYPNSRQYGSSRS